MADFVARGVDPTRTGTDDDKEHAAYHFQVRSLHLKPWQQPPCFLDIDEKPQQKDKQAHKILKRMVQAGISPWHPDPLRALAEA